MSKSNGCGNHSFHAWLAKGQQAEEAWVNEQQSQGYAIAHGTKVQPDESFRVGVDHCQHPDAVAAVRVELKTRDISFTGPNDYPYDTVFLGSASAAAKDISPPLIYVIQSEATGQWVWVCSLDRDDSWFVSDVWHRNRNHKVPTIQCPKSFLRSSDEIGLAVMHHSLLDLVDGPTGAFRGTRG